MLSGLPLHVTAETSVPEVLYFWYLYLGKLAFILLGCIFWVGHIHPRQLYMGFKKIPAGLLSLFFFWALIQASQILFAFTASQNMTVLRRWSAEESVLLTGAFLAMLLGKALFDEAVFRAYLIPQCYFKVSRLIKLPEGLRLGASILITQILYVLVQLPFYMAFMNDIRFISGVASLSLLSLLTTLLLLRTQNIYFGVVVHTLWYFPLFAVEVSFPTQLILFILVCTYLYLWPALQAGHKNQKKLAY